KILSLPRSLGVAADGEEITAQNGRFGPYLRKGSDSRSLESEEQLFTITLAQAEEIYAQPKQRRGRGQAKPPIAEFGNDPSSGDPVPPTESGCGRRWRRDHRTKRSLWPVFAQGLGLAITGIRRAAIYHHACASRGNLRATQTATGQGSSQTADCRIRQ